MAATRALAIGLVRGVSGVVGRHGELGFASEAAAAVLL